MKGLCKRILSVITALAIVATLGNFNYVGAADYTIEQMVALSGYNVALRKTITGHPSIQEGSVSYLSDGELTPGGNYAATKFGTANTFYLVDLGDVYDASTIDKLVVGYKENNDGDVPVNGYEVYYSANGIDFTKVKTVTGSQVKAQINAENTTEVESLAGITGKVRFVKILYKAAYNWGIQATEIALLSTEGNAQTVDPDRCSEAEAVNVEVTDFNTIKYSITPSADQNGFKYLVYAIKGSTKTLIGDAVDANQEYVYDELPAGYYTLKVVSCHDGAASEGIASEGFNVDDISTVVNSMKNIVNRAKGYPAVVSEAKFYDGHTINTALMALDGKLKSGEGSDACLRTAAGGKQSVVIDLGEYYTPSELEYVLTAHTNKDTCPSDVKVDFSQDGNTFIEVANKKGYEFSSGNNTCGINRINLTKINEYTKEAVRFVKLTFDGKNNYGFCINEISLLANTDEPTIVGSDIPDPSAIEVWQEKLASLSYEIIPDESQDENAKFIVSVDGTIVNNEAKVGQQYTVEDLSIGKHTVTASTIEGEWLSKGIKKEFNVVGYRNYINTALNVANRNFHKAVATTDSDNIRTDSWDPIGQDISAGVQAVNNGIYVDGGHHTGYLQTRSDSKQATVDLDLGQDYEPESLVKAIMVFNDAYTAATSYEILMSADGENYQEVYSTDNAKYEEFMEATFDFRHYTQESVRYVKYFMKDGPFAPYYKDDGTKNWEAIGYLLREIAIMRDDSVIPSRIKNVQVSSTEDNKFTVSYDKSDDEAVEYRIYMDGSSIGVYTHDDASTHEFTVAGGLHTIKVVASKDGYESLGNDHPVQVKDKPTTKAPTTAPTTKAPTTKAPTTKPVTKAPTVAPQTDAPYVEPQTQKAVKKPAKTAVKKAVKKKSAKKLTVKLKAVSRADGYQVAVYKTAKKAKKNSGAIVKKNIVKASATISSAKFKKLKFLFVRARAYVYDEDDYKKFGAWSAVKKTKK